MTTFLKTTLIAGLIAAGFAVSMPAQAEDGPFMVRARLLSMQTADKTANNSSIKVEDKVFPDVDISYFVTPNISLELVLTYPQTHNIEASGNKIGSLKHLPPTLLAQYRFDTGTPFQPYVGAGLNYTRIWGVSLPSGLSLDHSSIGLAGQVGADYKLDGAWSLNADVKYMKLEADLKSAGKKIDTVKVNPWLFGVGVGYRF